MKITCDIIEDLLPSYVDGILSDDSKALVDEHLKTCEKCRKNLNYMQKNEEHLLENEYQETAEAKNALLKIKRKLRLRKILVTIITAAAIFFITIASYHHWYWHESYLSYKESGMFIQNNKLYSTKNMLSRTKVDYEDNGKVQFIYAVNAGYAGKMDLGGKKSMLVQDFTRTTKAAPEDERTYYKVREVYYISKTDYETTLDELSRLYKGSDHGGQYTDPQKAAQLIQKMKSDGTLLWRKG